MLERLARRKRSRFLGALVNYSRIFLVFKLCVVTLSVIMLSVIILSVAILSVVMLSEAILSVIMLSAIKPQESG